MERRKARRIVSRSPVHYSAIAMVSRRIENITSSGQGVDLSEDDQGIGFVTEFPLEPGQILRLVKDEDGIRTALVRWVNFDPSPYRVGAVLV